MGIAEDVAKAVLHAHDVDGLVLLVGLRDFLMNVVHILAAFPTAIAVHKEGVELLFGDGIPQVHLVVARDGKGSQDSDSW